MEYRSFDRRKRRRKRWVQAGTGLLVLIMGTLLVRTLLNGAGSSTGNAGTENSRTNHTVPVITKGGSGTTAAVTSNSTATAATNSTTKTTTAGTTGGTSGHSVLPSHALLSVAAQNQHPQLPNGCEVTSLSMLLTAVGHPVSKMSLAKEAPRAPVSVAWKNNASGLPQGWRYDIASWGNPNKGFVGHMTRQPGYGIYHGPLTKLLNRVLPGQAVDLTGSSLQHIFAQVAHGVPVVMWVNTTFKPLPQSDWVTWNNPGGPIKATFFEHAVLLVGYGPNQLYINNPFNGQKAQPVNRKQFVAAWKQMGSQALTVKAP